MSGKLDQSLDQIMSDRKTNPRPQGGRRRPVRGAAQRAKAAITNPTAGVQKTKSGKANAKAPIISANISGDSKILVANLPFDVNETQVKDFFAKAIGSVKKVLISYGPNGRSRGEATVTFSKPNLAAQAVKQYNGVKIDEKPMRVEVVGGTILSAAAAKPLTDRMAKPNNAGKDKKAAGPKKVTANGTGGAAKGKGNKKSGRAGRPKAKTSEELDAEMQDYFGGAQTADNAGANGQAPADGTQPAAGGDTGMDEVL